MMKAPRFTFALFSSFFVLVISVTLHAQTSSNTTVVANPVFPTNCAKCHGKTAEGRRFAGPSLVSDKVKAASDDELRQIIANGKGRMPKFGGKLTPEEINTLVSQIRAMNTK